MKPAADARMSVSAERGAVTVRLSGAWRMTDPTPALTPVEAALSRDGAARLSLDARGVSAWEAPLVALALSLSRLAEARGAAFDADLPSGAEALLKLARATPPRGEKRGKRKSGGPLAAVGRAATGAWREAVATLAFLGEVTLSFGRLLTGRARFRRADFAELTRDAGADALPVVSLISILVGAILAFVGAIQLRAFGAQLFVADLVGVAMARDMGAIMTAIIVAGRTGASYAARIGTMQGAEEIDALRTMGLEPIDYLVLPRVLALVLMTPLLVLYANILGMLGGGLVGATLPGVTLAQYLARSQEAVSLADFAGGVFKGTVYGGLVAFAGCMRGMQCGRSAAAVGESTTSAVVTGIVYVIAAAALLTMVFHVLDI
ncbi:MAG: ABC transporter permease [Rhodobacteraceae bacterium]|nr:MAG: ABC transporter permease [Paracoccaceae bacterium]